MVIRMKKMNNKGFAISSMLYGLLLVAFLIVTLLMSIMQTNRSNTSTLVRRIEEDLNRFSRTRTEMVSDGTNTAKEYIVPPGGAGWYRIELWGASVATNKLSLDKSAGRGAYVSSVVYLPENQHLYFYLGKEGTGNNGGGATDVRVVPGGNDMTSKSSTFMLASGGAVAGSTNLDGYYYRNNNGLGVITYGDAGSFVSGYGIGRAVTPTGERATGMDAPDVTAEFDYTTKQAGTNEVYQVIIPCVNTGAGRAKIELVSSNGPNVLSSKKNGGNAAGIFAGATQIRFCVNTTAAIGNNNKKELFSEIQFITTAGKNLLASNVSFVSANGVSSAAANKEARINGEITDITNSSSFGKNQKYCITGNPKVKLDDIQSAVAYLTIDDTSTAGIGSYTIEIYKSSKWQIVKRISNLTDYEKTHGLRISNYNFDYDETADNKTRNQNYYHPTVPTANYYITMRSRFNKGLTAATTGNLIVSSDYYNGEKNQKWTIQQVGSDAAGLPIYSIVENYKSYALQPHDQGKEIGEAVSVKDKEYTGKSWQKWYIIGQKVCDANGKNCYPSGYFQIKSYSAATGINEAAGNQNLCLSSTSNGSVTLASCNINSDSQLFRLNTMDY